MDRRIRCNHAWSSPVTSGAQAWFTDRHWVHALAVNLQIREAHIPKGLSSRGVIMSGESTTPTALIGMTAWVSSCAW